MWHVGAKGCSAEGMMSSSHVRTQQWNKGWVKTKREKLEKFHPCPGEWGGALEAKGHVSEPYQSTQRTTCKSEYDSCLWTVLLPSHHLPSFLASLCLFTQCLAPVTLLRLKRSSAFEENAGGIWHGLHSTQWEEPGEWDLKPCCDKHSSSLPEPRLI